MRSQKGSGALLRRFLDHLPKCSCAQIQCTYPTNIVIPNIEPSLNTLYCGTLDLRGLGFIRQLPPRIKPAAHGGLAQVGFVPQLQQMGSDSSCLLGGFPKRPKKYQQPGNTLETTPAIIYSMDHKALGRATLAATGSL